MEKYRFIKSHVLFWFCFFPRLKYLSFLNNPSLFLPQIHSALCWISLGQPGKLSSGSLVPCHAHTWEYSGQMNCHEVRTLFAYWHCLLSESVQCSHFPSRFSIKWNVESASFHLSVARGNEWAKEGGKQARVWQGGGKIWHVNRL